MLGAVIGDLAAWTWENDHEKFYPRLISDKAELSEYGNMLISVSSLLMRNPNIDREAYVQAVQRKGWNMKHTMLRAIVVGWIADGLKDVPDLCQKFSLHVDKEDWYASNFISLLIAALRQGATKAKALMVNHISNFKSFLGSHWEKEGDYSVLGYLVRVWKAFALSYDFGSAIHKAVTLPGDKHFNCILMGALADAMYGHERYIIKKQYGHGCLLDLSKWVCSDVEEFYSKRRTYYPKNRADTNIERHHYRKVVNPFAFIKLEKGEYEKILHAYEPSMIKPYGFYLEDGWIYLYRDTIILGRFDFAPIDDGWRISNLHTTDDKPYWALLDAMAEAIADCGCPSAEKLAEVSSAAGLFVCFHGEDECPNEWKGGLKASFWHAERMFLETSQSIKHWREEALLFKREHLGQLPVEVNDAPETRLGVAIYIDLLLSKWNPYDNTFYLREYLNLQ